MVNTNEMIFGVRAVLEAIEAGKEVDKILVKRDLQSELSRELFAALKGRTIPVVRVPVEKLNRITRKNHQGVIAYISAVEYASVDTLVPTLYEEGKVPFLVLLDGITDVRNFGSIARTCDCAGVDAIIIPAHNSVTVNADAVKTSAGALHLRHPRAFIEHGTKKILGIRIFLFSSLDEPTGRSKEILLYAMSQIVTLSNIELRIGITGICTHHIPFEG